MCGSVCVCMCVFFALLLYHTFIVRTPSICEKIKVQTNLDGDLRFKANVSIRLWFKIKPIFELIMFTAKG